MLKFIVTFFTKHFLHPYHKIKYAHKINILPKSFWKIQKWTKINVQNGKLKILLENFNYYLEKNF